MGRDADQTEIKRRKNEEIPEEKWQAIVSNDAAYDFRFFYGVSTTGIFCRPSCKSRPPNKENVQIFQHADEALAARFRPCKRCKPTGEKLPDQEWVIQITDYIDHHFREKLSLEHLADVCHGSPFHLQRTFKRVQGISPVEYIQRKRIQEAIRLLTQTDESITEIAAGVGIPNVPYFITLFKKITGQTPIEFRQIRQHGAALEVHIHEYEHDQGKQK
ncbi:bifunctional transcriptional activator/DNA repair enzyme AdaA [Paenibacillus sp. XY044]|uniref:bifunctional transcriptional activator/DNA repair enzyme AdaA n=1 Tax=Paenibacillus sp. XY044 TaxID=2026089 RepID=UPI000B98DE2F|nr:bifunctional transcriptional activator/DNA repair enzyme AdaA [Paenibacillus sp. XY044]OZB99167.1 AraC family transcriptional regulator [Paenibacillus sp. XY044]